MACVAGRLKTGVGRAALLQLAGLQRMFIFNLYAFTIMETTRQSCAMENFIYKHDCRREKAFS